MSSNICITCCDIQLKNCDHESFLCDVFYEGKDFFEIRYKLKFDRSEEELGK